MGLRPTEGWRTATLCEPGKHSGESGELAQAQEERVSNELHLSGMKMPPPNDHDGGWCSARHAAQIAKPQRIRCAPGLGCAWTREFRAWVVLPELRHLGGAAESDILPDSAMASTR
jgi:hypothetical protein